MTFISINSFCCHSGYSLVNSNYSDEDNVKKLKIKCCDFTSNYSNENNVKKLKSNVVNVITKSSMTATYSVLKEGFSLLRPYTRHLCNLPKTDSVSCTCTVLFQLYRNCYSFV